MVNTTLSAAAGAAAAGLAAGAGAGWLPSAGNIPSTLKADSSWSGATAALSRLLASEKLSNQAIARWSATPAGRERAAVG